MSIDFNGWEFIEWGTSDQDAEEKLSMQNIPFKPCKPNQKLLSTKFEYNGFDTNLHYDNGLYDVQQYKYFKTNQKDAAGAFFRNICNELIQKYGTPNTKNINEIENKENLEWSLKYTKITLVYFSGNEPEILLQFNPKN